MRAFLEQIIVEAGEMAKKHFEAGVSFSLKSNQNDYLTIADTETSEFLVSSIQREFPTHTIISEEMPQKIEGVSEYTWYIDPIDGTRNFAHGIPTWAVMIAVQKQGETILSGVYFPMSKQLFVGDSEAGCVYKNGVMVHAQLNRTDLVESIGLFGLHTEKSTHVSHVDVFVSAFHTFYQSSGGRTQTFGCSAMLVYVCDGTFTFACRNSGLDWDYLPIAHMGKLSGCLILTSDGLPWTQDRRDLIVVPPRLHDQFLSYFKQ